MMYQPFDKTTASLTDRVAWHLCQIIDDDAPMRWTRYRSAAVCIVGHDETLRDILALAVQKGKSPDHAARVAELEAEVARLNKVIELKNHALDRYMPCPDHRDKVERGVCQVCKAERAEARGLRELLGEARDYVSDALVQERAAYKGYEHMSSIVEIETDLAKIDAALKDTP